MLAVAVACSDSRDTTAAATSTGGAGGEPTAGGAGGATPEGTGGSTATGGGGVAGGSENANGEAGAAAAGAAGATGAGGDSSSEALSPRLTRYHRLDTDRALHFELDAVAGLSPYASTLEYLDGFMARALDKPEGVAFDMDETLAPAGADHVYGFEELDAFARQHAQDDTDGAVTIHVLFLDGRYDPGDGDGTVLGLAWGQRHIALFQDAIRSGCSGGVLGALSADPCEIAERNVWAHEIGHVIGLVDNGLPQQANHRDAEHGRHDASDGCLMYWAYDRPEMFELLLSRLNGGQSQNVDFCENCWADLNAARE